MHVLVVFYSFGAAGVYVPVLYLLLYCEQFHVQFYSSTFTFNWIIISFIFFLFFYVETYF